MGFDDGFRWRAFPTWLLADEAFLSFAAPLNESSLLLRLYGVSNRHGIFPAGGWALRSATGLVGETAQFDAAVCALVGAGFIATYEAEGRLFGIICDFAADMPAELTSKRPESRLPLPPCDLAEQVGYQEGWRRHWPGSDQEPGNGPDIVETERENESETETETETESRDRKEKSVTRASKRAPHTRQSRASEFVPEGPVDWECVPRPDQNAAARWLRAAEEARAADGDPDATYEAVSQEYSAGLYALWQRHQADFRGGVGLMIEKGEGLTNKGASALRFLKAKIGHWKQLAESQGCTPEERFFWAS